MRSSYNPSISILLHLRHDSRCLKLQFYLAGPVKKEKFSNLKASFACDGRLSTYNLLSILALPPHCASSHSLNFFSFFPRAHGYNMCLRKPPQIPLSSLLSTCALIGIVAHRVVILGIFPPVNDRVSSFRPYKYEGMLQADIKGRCQKYLTALHPVQTLRREDSWVGLLT